MANTPENEFDTNAKLGLPQTDLANGLVHDQGGKGKKVKKAFPLRLDADMLVQLERWAAAEFRSVNGQIEYLLHQALQQRNRTKS